MNEEQIEHIVESAQTDQAPPPAEAAQVLSPKRRSALVTYLAILFAVAFLFVAVTMGIEARRLKNVNQELQDSSQKTSASLTGNINALQAENERLAGELEARNAEVAQLETEIVAARDSLTALSAEHEALTAERDALKAEQETMREQLKVLTQRAEDAVTVSELLHRAIAADEKGDMEELQKLLEEITPLAELLSPTEAEIYESLLID